MSKRLFPGHEKPVLNEDGSVSIGAKIVDVTDPTDDQDAATKAYVDAEIDAHEEAADPHTGYQLESEKGEASGYASLDGDTKVVEQPASITDHLEGTPTEDEATKTPTSEWAYDHENSAISSSVHGNIHRAKVTMAADQYAKGDPTAFWSKLALDTESYDPGSNFDVSTFYTGTCTAGTNATTLVDSEANFADDSEIVIAAGGGVKVSWDDGASYGYVVSRDSATQLTIAKVTGNDLDVDDVYTIKHAKYVAPVAGYYHISAVVFYRYTGLLADKVYMARLTVNGAEVASSASHSAVASQNLSCAISEPIHLDAGDRVELFGWHVAAVDTIILRSGTSYSRFMIELIEAD